MTYTNHTCHYCGVGYEIDHDQEEPRKNSLAFEYCGIVCAEHADAIVAT